MSEATDTTDRAGPKETYPDWEWGDPCPSCGSLSFAYRETTTTEVTPTNDGDAYIAGDVLTSTDEVLECRECWAVLPVDEMPD